MRWTIIGFLSLVILITQTSCGQASFTGGSGSSSNNNGDAPNPNPNPNPNPGTTPGPTTTVPGGGTTPPATNPNGTNTTTGTVTPGTVTPGITYPGTTSPNYSPGAPGAPGYNTIPSCPGTPCQPGVPTPTYGPIGQVQQPTPNSMVFGGSQSLHIGNGRFENTSCRAQVSSIPLSGSIYFFQFQVMQDNTTVNVNIANICGVDYASSTLQIAQNNSKMSQLPVPVGAPSLALPSQVLNHGVYTVYIYSGKGNGNNGPTWDSDDFIVGQVQVSGSQQVMPLNYGAFQ